MAQAKAKASQQSSRKRSGSSGAKRKSQPRSRSQARPKARAPQSSSNGQGGQSKPAEVVGVVEEKAKEAGKGVGRAVKRARVPLLAGGAVIAGAAGGAALASRQAHRHRGLTHSVRRIDSDDVAKAARRVGDVGARVGRFAVDFQRARESSNGAGGARHRSPVEVVLDGLTARR